jgi:hypothetical protein
VDGRRVIFMGPLDGSDPSREETCDRWKYNIHISLCIPMQSGSGC